MKQKFIRLIFAAMFITLSLNTFAISAAKEATNPKTTPTEINTAKAEQLMSRLNEIKAMDKSNMSRIEKRTLRKEVKTIRKEMKANNGIYLSIGAIIIIVLLLILLL